MGETIKWLLEWSLKIIGILVVVGFTGAVMYGVSYPFIEKWKLWRLKRNARELKSFTSWIKGEVLTTSSIESVRKAFNSKVDIGAIRLKDIVSITHSPHAQGHQFTVWYRERPEVPDITHKRKNSYGSKDQNISLKPFGWP